MPLCANVYTLNQAVPWQTKAIGSVRVNDVVIQYGCTFSDWQRSRLIFVAVRQLQQTTQYTARLGACRQV